MNSESRICQSCKKEFHISPDSFVFYEKINVPPPTWCPPCRNRRRFACREERSLYKGTCELCKKVVISVYPPETKFTVYCRDCWISDKWDPMGYGRDYDFNTPFFVQYQKLMEAMPRPSVTGTNVVNSEYSHACLNCKNCYFTFWSYFTEDSQYAYICLLSRNVFDSYVADNSDHAYETIHSNRLYRVRFAYFADECLDASFLYDCIGCSYCFGCVNKRKGKYLLFNKQVSKEEYAEAMRYWDLGSYARLIEAKEKFRELYLSAPHKYAHAVNSENVSGDIIRDAKNCDTCFSVFDGVRDCKFTYIGGLNLKDSQDVSGGGDTSSLLYETMGVSSAQSCRFSTGSGRGFNVEYSNWISNSSDIFACSSLKNKKYCILNKQYSPHEYRVMVAKIKKHMDEMPYTDKAGRVYTYGEFFPMELSAYPYNESFAGAWYPKTKEEVLAEGLWWHDPAERSYEVTIKTEDIPDHIRDVSEAMTQEIIQCAHNGGCNQQCSTAFRVTSEEVAFYKDMNIALPRLCPSCRYSERLEWRNRFDLYHRTCVCEGKQARSVDGIRTYENVSNHFHGDAPCPHEFETTYAPDKPEMIYCNECYQTEFL